MSKPQLSYKSLLKVFTKKNRIIFLYVQFQNLPYTIISDRFSNRNLRKNNFRLFSKFFLKSLF